MSAAPVVVALAKYLPDDKLDDAVQLLDEQGLAKLHLFASEIEDISEAVGTQVPANDEEEARAVELMSRGCIAIKELDALRRKHVDPLNAQVRGINALFKVVTDPCEALVGKSGRLERLILAYRTAKRARIQREQEEARRKQEEAARRGAEALAKAETAKTEAARKKALAEAEAASQAQAEALVSAPREMTRGLRTDSGSVSERRRYAVDTIDPDKVPPIYWRDPMVLEALRKVLQRAVTAGARDIPGVAIGLEEGLTRRPGL